MNYWRPSLEITRSRRKQKTHNSELETSCYDSTDYKYTSRCECKCWRNQYQLHRYVSTPRKSVSFVSILGGGRRWGERERQRERKTEKSVSLEYANVVYENVLSLPWRWRVAWFVAARTGWQRLQSARETVLSWSHSLIKSARKRQTELHTFMRSFCPVPKYIKGWQKKNVKVM